MPVQPGAPKKNLTSYMIFCSEERAKGNITTTPNEQAVELGRRWRSLSPEEKNIFNEKAKREKERYQRDLAMFSSERGSSEILDAEESVSQAAMYEETGVGGVIREGKGAVGEMTQETGGESAMYEEGGEGGGDREGDQGEGTYETCGQEVGCCYERDVCPSGEEAERVEEVNGGSLGDQPEAEEGAGQEGIGQGNQGQSRSWTKKKKKLTPGLTYSKLSNHSFPIIMLFSPFTPPSNSQMCNWTYNQQ